MTNPACFPVRHDIAEAKLERAMARRHYARESLYEILHIARRLYGSLSKPLLETIAWRLRLPFRRVLLIGARRALNGIAANPRTQ